MGKAGGGEEDGEEERYENAAGGDRVVVVIGDEVNGNAVASLAARNPWSTRGTATMCATELVPPGSTRPSAST